MALLACTNAAAQPPDLSTRKLTMIVGFAPGGGVDTLARVVAQEMTISARLSGDHREPAGRGLQHRGEGGRGRGA